ncbi:MAG: hypothetical protein GY730_03355 [bacterium]|nr:hypothetical protein [bacterium]
MNKIIALKSTDKNISEIQLNSGKINLLKSVYEKFLIENLKSNTEDSCYLVEQYVKKIMKNNPSIVPLVIIDLISKYSGYKKEMILYKLNNDLGNCYNSMSKIICDLYNRKHSSDVKLLSAFFSAPDEELCFSLTLSNQDKVEGSYNSIITLFNGLVGFYNNYNYSLFGLKNTISTSTTTESISLFISSFTLFLDKVHEKFAQYRTGINDAVINDFNNQISYPLRIFNFFGIDTSILNLKYEIREKDQMDQCLINRSAIQSINKNLGYHYGFVFLNFKVHSNCSRFIAITDNSRNRSKNRSKNLNEIWTILSIRMPKLVQMFVATRHDKPALTDIDLSKLNDSQYIAGISNELISSNLEKMKLVLTSQYSIFEFDNQIVLDKYKYHDSLYAHNNEKVYIKNNKTFKCCRIQ